MSLELRNLTVGYGDRALIADITAQAASGRLIALIGANGCGKSTLLRTITGSLMPLAGSVMLGGRPLGEYKTASLARRLSAVLTDRTGGGGLRVEELVAIGRHPYSGFFGRLSAEDRGAVDAAIEAVGLVDKRHSFVASLSDGERQKAMIARAMAQCAEVMVLDEPTTFLDVAARFEIMGLLRDIADRGTAMVLSTHDIAPALAAADTIWAVAEGRLHCAPKDEMVSSAILDHVYPGVHFDPERLDFRQ